MTTSMDTIDSTLELTHATIEKGNKGEKDEIAFQRELFTKKLDHDYLKKLFLDYCGEGGIELINPNTRLAYTNVKEITKTKSTSKADFIVRYKNICGQLQTWNISYKSFRGGKPSILNHTPRSANIFQESGELHLDVSGLDILAKEYIEKRNQGLFGEDVIISRFDTYHNDSVRQSIQNTVAYFVFKGTGRGKDKHGCNSIMIKNRDGSHTFRSCDTDEDKLVYVRSIIEKCVISFRNKGMPKKTRSECQPWVYMNADGIELGSIHVRMAQH